MSPSKSRVTMADVAARAGVAVSTVSYVLNSARTSVPISKKTKAKVLQAAQEAGYQPNAAARALVTNRTDHIGFVLSDTVEGGLQNAYYSSILAGTERACREAGFGMNVSLYNLSNIDTFVFPPRIGQRSVDGIILTGYVEATVVEKFREFAVPCVCVGDSVELGDIVPTIATDIVDGLGQAVLHAFELGHRCVGYHVREARRPHEILKELTKRVASRTQDRCDLVPLETAGLEGGHAAAETVANLWQSLPETRKPTVIITSDQTAQGLLRWFRLRGMHCPADIGLICEGDTDLCEFTDPPLTAIRLNQKRLGYLATQMLIDHLDGKAPLTVDMSANDYPCKLVIRESCQRLAADAQ